MKNQINISNLTPEQIEEVRQQLKAFDEQPKSIMDKVKSWEDASNIINPRFWIDIYGEIDNGDVVPYKNHVPSKKHAKSILATSQLMVISEALNEGNKDNRVGVYWDGKVFQYITYAYEYNYNIIKFKDVPTAKYAMSQFPELWHDYFMIDKPE